MNFEIVLVELLLTSTFTGLVTEAVKKLLDDYNISYHANMLAGIVALVVSLLIGAGYMVIANVPLTASAVVYIICLVLLSWLCAMVGYDKVIQTITQLRSGETDVEE